MTGLVDLGLGWVGGVGGRAGLERHRLRNRSSGSKPVIEELQGNASEVTDAFSISQLTNVDCR